MTPTRRIADQPHQSLSRLIEILTPGQTDILAFMEVYFDESGSHDGSDALCVAAYLFEKEKCLALDLAWKIALGEYSLPYFHMVDCAHGVEPFDKLSMEERIAVEKRMINIIRENMTSGFAVSVNEVEYNSWRPQKNDYIGSAYSFCCWWCLTGIQIWLEQNNYEGDVSYFFEAGHASQSEANAVMNRIFENPARRKAYRYLSHSFVDKEKIRPVQAPDILAWLHCNHLKWTKKGRKKPRADFLALVKDRPHRAVIGTRETLYNVIALFEVLDQKRAIISGSFGRFRFMNWS